MIPPRPAPAHVVASALADVATLGPFFTITVGGPADGWRAARDGYAAGIPDLVSATAHRHGVGERSRIAASIAQLGHAAHLWSPPLACALLHQVVPDLTELQRQDGRPALRLPRAHGRRVDGADVHEVAALIHRMVIEDHLRPLAAGLKIKIAGGLLWGNAASALAEAARTIADAYPALGTSAARLATAVLEIEPLRNTGRFTGPGLGFRRRSCCLYYRAPAGAHCADCALTRGE
ncbi:(2Fe-2S)-binding protein [Actinomadura nitritigenes]|uniref:(2Fe-2S)-binding protein n=1 Tax=Actinomadura nitritigenes TaxID=134602 RepID=UPI003D93E064